MMLPNAPYGYRKVSVWDEGVRRYNLELDPPASDAVRKLFDLRLEGAAKSLVAAELNARGVRPPGAGRWGRQAGDPHPGKRGLLRHQRGGGPRYG